MWGLVGNLEDRISHNEAHFIPYLVSTHSFHVLGPICSSSCTCISSSCCYNLVWVRIPYRNSHLQNRKISSSVLLLLFIFIFYTKLIDSLFHLKSISSYRVILTACLRQMLKLYYATEKRFVSIKSYLVTLKCGITYTSPISYNVTVSYNLSRIVRKRAFAYAKTKTQISCAVTAQLNSAFVFAIRTVQSLFYLNPKFQASSHLLWLYSSVCVGPSRKTRKPVFSQRGSFIKHYRFTPISAHLKWLTDDGLTNGRTD